MSGKAYCANCVKLQEKVYRLREENKRLKAKLCHQERKITEGYFGSSTPSSKKPHKVKATQENQSKTGGAQRGHRGFGRKEVPVEEADEVVTLDAPESCPDCGTSLTGKGMRERGVIDLEPVTIKKIVYRLKRKRCPRCQRTVQAPIPGVMPKCLYSNRLLAHVAVEHYVNGLTLGYLEDQTGVGIGALIDGMHHLRRVLQSVPDRLIHDYRQAAVKQADETGWSSDGVNGYAWLFCTPDISIYRFRKTRSGKVPQAVLEDKPLPGVLVVDRYNGYNRSPCKIQYCYVHLLRKVRDLEKEFPQNSEIAAFVQTVKPLLKNAINLRTLPIKDRQYYELARKTKNMLVAVMTKEANHPGIQEIQNIFRENPHRLYHWVDSRNVPSDNNRSERELRPLVIARKISFGSQSDEGLKTREVLMTVLGTLYKRYPQDVLTKLENFLNQYALNPNIDPYLFLFNYTS